jgi:hypothetical protein
MASASTEDRGVRCRNPERVRRHRVVEEESDGVGGQHGASVGRFLAGGGDVVEVTAGPVDDGHPSGAVVLNAGGGGGVGLGYEVADG